MLPGFEFHATLGPLSRLFIPVLLAHALLDELVPVVDGEGPGRDDKLVP